jgi:23S rRNA pseudouridine2605 synthase
VTDSNSRDKLSAKLTNSTGSAVPESAESGDDSVRLQVYLAHAGVASRRAAEELIRTGHVSVNGSTVTGMGSKVSPSDVVCVDGRRVFPEEMKRYVLLNKPSGYVCSLSDEKGRPVAVDILKKNYAERLYNIGRLDMYSAGAIIFTNDGDFAAVVGHPSAEIEKEYVVEASLPFRDEVLEAFKKGIRIDTVFYKCRAAERLSSRRLRVVLVEGKNREIRKVLEHFGVRVKSLIRVRIGSVGLDGLKYGEFRDLSASEIDSLLAAGKRQAGMEENA